MINTQNFHRRWQEIKNDVLEGLEQIHQNETVVNGYFTQQVEEKLKLLSGRKYAVLCRSGSHAISMSLRAYDLGSWDKVIIPNYSCPATLSSVNVIGCVPVFCEVNEFGSLDSDRLLTLANSDAKAVLATGLYGDVHDHAAVKEFCIQNKMIYVNDAAQSQFALYNGANSLTLGDVVCMSFADNKVIPTSGTFGAVLTDNQNIYEKLRVLRKNGKPGRLEDYEVAGFSSHPEEDKAVQILASMKHFEKWKNKRIAIGKIYDEFFKDKIVVRPSPSYSTWNGHKYSILVEDKFECYKKLKQQGIETEQHYVDSFVQLLWTPKEQQDEDFSISNKFIQQSLTLPNNPHMTDEEIERVAKSVLMVNGIDK